ncbi:hypothetical protein DLAC_07692 [Tieghemostelium lacteum]|uniref:Phosphoribosyltransferase domain-containing protein n=1 Tax=Tieghemostelium lacteum TaxID=361077 RepID=A0A151ZAA3_TIELA|nr:hypothetical protein DLAC_07692 [Tieghemostelium lacteum]|eukprot:KYQ90824.1 hypothetical protein DLAC_07692 [Tieghemostelium lacteum]
MFISNRLSKFLNREDAGQKLAQALNQFKGRSSDTIIVALPRGGVPVAYQVCKELSLPLDIVAPRKIGAPFNKEYAIGAIAENGDGYLNDEVIRAINIPSDYLESEMKKQRDESIRRQKIYRCDRPPTAFTNKIIILVDDGIATGSTIKAAIASIKVKNPKEIIVAVPVAPKDALKELKSSGDVSHIECLYTPKIFEAVGCFYQDFDQTEDDTVISLMSDKSFYPTIEKPQQ